MTTYLYKLTFHADVFDLTGQIQVFSKGDIFECDSYNFDILKQNKVVSRSMTSGHGITLNYELSKHCFKNDVIEVEITLNEKIKKLRNENR